MRVDLNRFTRGQFLNADDLKDKSVVTIKDVVPYVFDRMDRLKLMLEGIDDKALPLNSTNIKRMIDKFGDESDKWIGKKITITKTKSRGEFESSFLVG
jgi:hypothetical protein